MLNLKPKVRVKISTFFYSSEMQTWIELNHESGHIHFTQSEFHDANLKISEKNYHVLFSIKYIVRIENAGTWHSSGEDRKVKRKHDI